MNTPSFQLSLFPELPINPDDEAIVDEMARKRQAGWSVKPLRKQTTEVPAPMHTDTNEPTTLNLFDFAKEAHQNALDHGWYHNQKTGEPEERAVSDILQNFEGEILEFRVEVCCQKYEVDPDTLKPDGAWIELADLLIRMADAIGYFLKDHPDDRFGTTDYGFVEVNTRRYITTLTEGIKRRTYLGDFEPNHSRYVADWLSAQISILWEMYRRTPQENFIIGLWDAYVCVFELLNREYPGKIVPAILLKHEYNKSRPYRHGGLRA